MHWKVIESVDEVQHEGNSGESRWCIWIPQVILSGDFWGLENRHKDMG